MRCGVTGATGYLGSHCCAALRARGHDVIRLVRRPSEPGDRAYALGGATDPAVVNGLDALVHCAHDFSERHPRRVWAVNAEGGAALVRLAASARVRRQVVISTVAAFEECASDYGRGKLYVEAAAVAAGAAVLRPGLLWSETPRGLFGTLRRLARLPLLPVFDGGEQPLVLAHVADVAAVVVAAVEAPGPWVAAPLSLAHPRVWTFGGILHTLAREQGRTLRTLPVPSGVALRGLRLLERVGLGLPFRSDSLVSLLHPPSLQLPHNGVLGVPFRAWP